MRQSVRAAAWMALVGYGFVTAAGVATGYLTLNEFVPQFAVMVAAIFTLQLLHMGRIRTASTVLLTAASAEFIMSIVTWGDFGAPATVALPFLVLAAGLQLGIRWAWAVAVVSVGSSAGLLFGLRAIGWLDFDYPTTLYHAFVVFAVVVATAAFVTVGLRSFRLILEEARRGEVRAARLVDEAPDGIALLDSAFRVLHLNPVAETVLGGKLAQYRGLDILSVMAPADSLELEERFRRALDDPKGGGPLRVGASTYDGQILEVTARRRPDADREDPRGSIHMMFRDVTQQVELEDRAARLGHILEEAGNEVLIFERESGRIMLLSRGARRSLGLGPGETPETIEEIDPTLGPEGRARLSREVEQLGGAPFRARAAHRRPAGEMYPVEVEYLEGHLDQAEVFIAFAVDVSDRERVRDQRAKLQSQLEHAQRMEAIGHLAGGVAHDFNNLLTVIAVCGGELREVVPEDAQHLADDLLEAQETGQKLTRQLLAFARKDVVRRESLLLGETIDDSVSILRRLAGPGVQVSTDLEPGVRIFADLSQLEQILINLVSNASDAMDRRGHIHLELDRASVGETEWARLRVRDDGPGMSTAVQERVFEPFFTTKDVGKGTGLGLSTIHGIVTQNGGAIDVDSTPGIGTTFEILWPIDHAGEAAATEEEEAEAEEPVPAATILIAEDNEAAGELFRRALMADGHRVILTHDGVEGLETAREALDEIDLVLTDVVMPRMSGPDMVRELRGLGLESPVLFVSGYMDGNLGRVEAERRSEILMKPFRADELLRSVRRLLRGTGGEDPSGDGTLHSVG